MYPLSEMLLLLTCSTIAPCDDFDEVVAWGEHHLEFLRQFAPFHFGIPCERWLRTLVNRVDPILFGRCFEGWLKDLWPAGTIRSPSMARPRAARTASARD